MWRTCLFICDVLEDVAQKNSGPHVCSETVDHSVQGTPRELPIAQVGESRDIDRGRKDGEKVPVSLHDVL